MNTQTTIEEVSVKLRALRISKSLSLSDVEHLSNGELKAVVLGSYERGARTLSVKRAIAIAALYGVPVSQLFSDQPPIEVVNSSKIIIDLRAINRRALDISHSENSTYLLIARIAQRIIRSRQDWNGEVLSVRHSDVEVLATVLDKQISETIQWLEQENVLLKRREAR